MKFVVRRTHKQNDIEITEFKEVNTRSIIAISILAFCGLFLMGASIYGWIYNDFSGLKNIVLYIQSPLAALCGYYFGTKYESKNHDTGSDGTA